MNREIQTFSIVAGTEACNAKCPFCVAKMTPLQGIAAKTPEVNWPRFKRAFELATEGKAQTAMVTGKGEPTLFPHQVTEYFEHLANLEEETGLFILNKEIQTNGILLETKPDKFDPLLQMWVELGLTTVAISIVHHEPEANRRIYMPYAQEYIDLPHLSDKIHRAGAKVRLACVMVNGLIDDPLKVEELREFALKNAVEELTIRPVNKPTETRNDDIFYWTNEHHLKPGQLAGIRGYLRVAGDLVKQLRFGAEVYEVRGQNICLTNSLTPDDDPNFLRQLIFFPDGTISTDWTEKGENLP